MASFLEKHMGKLLEWEIIEKICKIIGTALENIGHMPHTGNMWEMIGRRVANFEFTDLGDDVYGFIQGWPSPKQDLNQFYQRPGRRKFRSQTSDNMERWKAEQGRGREKRKIRREKIRRERVRRKKMQMRENVGKSRNTAFFQWFVAPEGRKVGSLKRRVRSQLARWEMNNCTPLWREAHLEKLRCRKSARRCGAKQISKSKCTKHTSVGPLLEVAMSKKCTPLWREAHFQVKMYKTHHYRTTFGSWDVEKVHAVVARSSKCTKHTIIGPLLEVEMSKKCTPLWREAHFQVKMYKTHQCRTTFGSWDVEKVHAVVARSTFPSENVQSTPCSDHFWKLRCRKSARRCGAKHISKSKCTKHTIVGPLLEVEMSKKCTPLWREAHFQVKMYKTHHARTTFGSWDVEKVHAVVARSTFPSQNVQNTSGCQFIMWSCAGVLERSNFCA